MSNKDDLCVFLHITRGDITESGINSDRKFLQLENVRANTNKIMQHPAKNANLQFTYCLAIDSSFIVVVYDKR